ncbi:hypothetical protein GCM10007981_11230 [Thermocladium modestius]|uniref:Uncharacterized protein n=1 Tax=Thermocladium modestius TaxID=62609 RepID=A0A830GYM7_9CREN|nr:hypothetical protein [Thermocladium modestius]GGP20978.1 hypothetical protein GCM10007981_11230 [Thermocladium modestius]
MSIESFKALQGVEVRARVRIYGPTNSYIPIPSFVRYLGFDERARVIVVKGSSWYMYETAIRRPSSTRYGVTLPKRVIDALSLSNDDEVTAIILRPVTREYDIGRGRD